MAAFVLIHGGWHGGWCWDEVADRLRNGGHRAFAPTLTGLGERSHLIDCVTGPDTHVKDVENLIRWRNLDDVVLVGHSYGGMVITGVASAVPERIGRLVYLDAFVPTVGGVAANVLSTPGRAAEIASARRSDGHIDPTGFHRWVSDPEKIEWLKSRCTPHPATCFGNGVTLSGREAEVPRKDYILCERHEPSPFRQFHELYADRPGWRSFTLPCLHDAMIEMPDELTEILLRE